MPTILAFTALFTFLLAASTARAHAPYGQPGYIASHLHPFREYVNDRRAAKCLARFRYKHTAAELRIASDVIRRRVRLAYKPRHWNVHAVTSRCAPVIPWPWDALARCESGGNWAYNGSSGFDGGLQFLPSTWSSAKGLVAGASVYAYAWQAPAIVQVRVAQAWLARTSWAQWPACSAALGLR